MFVPLPSGFSTGVYPGVQLAPQMQTGIEYVNISEADFPTSCDGSVEGGFFVDYQAEGSVKPVLTRLVACMPTDVRTSPWQPTYNRQDIEETLYLHISPGGEFLIDPELKFWKITARTTLGYFELPSARNGHTIGPLLDNAVIEQKAGWGTDPSDLPRKRASNATGLNYGNMTLFQVPNPGPLTKVALALFGYGSYIHRHLTDPASQMLDLIPSWEGGPEERHPTGTCTVLQPLNGLSDDRGLRCLRDSELLGESEIRFRATGWIKTFASPDTMRISIETAAFLANKAWFKRLSFARFGRQVYFDDGVSFSKVSVSALGVIAVSVLLGAHLFGLLALALYAFWMKPWASHLGSEVMIRMGASYAEVLGTAKGEYQWMQTADACPGFIGDERSGGSVGLMRFGAAPSLSRTSERRFEWPE